MKIVINGKEFTETEMKIWKKKRIKKVLPHLKSNLNITDNIDVLSDELVALKMSFSYEDILSLLKTKLFIGEKVMKLASILSRGRCYPAITTIYAEGVDAKTLSVKLDALMFEATKEYQKVNMAAFLIIMS